MHSQDIQEIVNFDAGKFRCEKERVHSESRRHPFGNKKREDLKL